MGTRPRSRHPEAGVQDPGHRHRDGGNERPAARDDDWPVPVATADALARCPSDTGVSQRRQGGRCRRVVSFTLTGSAPRDADSKQGGPWHLVCSFLWKTSFD
jgi:hypothetical protein